jgi:hypothetical protein
VPPLLLSIGYCLWAVVYCLCTAVPAATLPAPVQAVARTAVLALPLQAPVVAVARTAVPALPLQAPVQAVARTAVLAGRDPPGARPCKQ